MKKENTTLSDNERRRVELLRNEIIGLIVDEQTAQKKLSYDDDDEEYDDYNTDEPSPIDEEPVYDTCNRVEKLYRLYRKAILQTMN